MTPLELKKLLKKRMVEVGLTNDVRVRKGNVEIRRSYFYHNGMSADSFATAIQGKIGPKFKVTGEDNWNAWPKESFFAAIVELA